MQSSQAFVHGSVARRWVTVIVSLQIATLAGGCAQNVPQRASIKEQTAELQRGQAETIASAVTPVDAGADVKVGELRLALPAFAAWQTSGAQNARGIQQVLYEGESSGDGRYRIQIGYQRVGQSPIGGVASVPDELPYDQVNDYARLDRAETTVAGADACRRSYYRSTTVAGWLANQFCVQGDANSTLAASVVLESDGGVSEAEFRRRADALFDTVTLDIPTAAPPATG